ncbi:hypothetical protein N7470_005665 [Penicillium chermesinum]|nr:hypothetical protein N7470_005665 [Penicillium chermesinum]
MGKEDFIRQIENSDEFKLLDRVIKEEATVQDGVQNIVNVTMSALATHGPNNMNKIGLADYNISLATMELAQRLEPSTGKHTKLVELLSHLQKQIATDPSTDEPLKVQGIPSGQTCRLLAIRSSRPDPCDATLDPEQRSRWVNLNAFIAQLTQAAEIDYPSWGKKHIFSPGQVTTRYLDHGDGV